MDSLSQICTNASYETICHAIKDIRTTEDQKYVKGMIDMAWALRDINESRRNLLHFEVDNAVNLEERIKEEVKLKERAEEIQRWIDARKERDEIVQSSFGITILIDDPDYQITNKVIEMLHRNGVSYQWVDTFSGAWNLNRDWIETVHMPCIVEYCGVYPINWMIEDVTELEKMEAKGEIFILVYHQSVDGEDVPNH